MTPVEHQQSVLHPLLFFAGLFMLILAFIIVFFAEGDGSFDSAFRIGGIFIILFFAGALLMTLGLVLRRAANKQPDRRSALGWPILRVIIIFGGLFMFVSDMFYRKWWGIWSLLALGVTFLLPLTEKRLRRSNSPRLRKQSKLLAFLITASVVAVVIYLASQTR